ncbi:MAG: glycosyltransferase [Firmicutes bacterium]|nr:glycosyltransferase [Candidatus Caballimonas caccae]
MRVLQINAVCGNGSTGLIVKDIASQVEKNGDEAFVAFQNGQASKNFYVFNNKFDEKLHALYTRIFGKQGYASKRETKKFLKWVSEIKPDIVHLHNLHGNYINLPMLLNYLSKNDIATVVTLHDCWFFTGKCTHYVEYKCDRWQESCGKCPQKHANINSIFFDKSSKVLFDREKLFVSIPRLKIVGCSKWIAEECKKSKLKNCDITYIHNGVDTSIFKPTNNEFRKKNNLEDKFVVLGFANKWGQERNREAVLYIISTLKEDERIVLVGCDNKMMDNFSKFDNVICVGFIKDRNELADIYSSCDVFLNLTHADTLPTVNMESICSGTPVITYDVCGSPELVDSGSGFVVPENDYIAIVEAKNFIKFKNFNIEIEKYHEKFSKTNNYLKYIDVYKELLNN